MGYHSAPAIYVDKVQFKVTDLQKSIQFYQELLGFKILEQNKKQVKLTADGMTNILTLIEPADAVPKPSRTTGLYHFALLLPKRVDLALFVTHLDNHNVRFGAADHLVSEAIYFEDPDGNGIEVYADTDPSTWSWQAGLVAMDTIPLDFDDLMFDIDLENQSWKGMPDQTIIGHIHLHVSDLKAAQEFYTKGLGFNIVSRLGDSALFLSTADYHHHIAVNIWNGPNAPRPPKNSAGLDYYRVVVPKQEMLEKILTNLAAIGTKINNKDSAITVEDPAGNSVQLIIETAQ